MVMADYFRDVGETPGKYASTDYIEPADVIAPLIDTSRIVITLCSSAPAGYFSIAAFLYGQVKDESALSRETRSDRDFTSS